VSKKQKKGAVEELKKIVIPGESQPESECSRGDKGAANQVE